jgi:hypothetical protein
VSDEDTDIITFTTVGRLKSADMFERTSNDQRILNAKPEGGREKGRLKLRWEDGVDNDVKALGEGNWKRHSQE